MKKLILTSACVLAVAGAAFAQGSGSVQWTAISFADFTAQTNTTLSSYMSGGGVTSLQGGTSGLTVGASAGAFYYELLYSATSSASPTTKAALSGWSDTGLEGESSTSATAGRAQVMPAQSSSQATVPFSGTDYIMLVGWSANLGTTWSAAENLLNAGSGWTGTAFFGESSVGSVTPLAAGTSPGATVFGSPGIVSLNTPLYEVTPEPTTLALAGLGGLSLLALRRKKA